MDGQTIAYIIAAIGCVIGIAGWLRNSNSDAGWYERGTLADADMVEVQTLIEERDRKAAEDAAAEAERVRLEALNAKYAAWEITEEGLGAHTVAELAEYMADWGIAATDCNLKADFVAAILAALIG